MTDFRDSGVEAPEDEVEDSAPPSAGASERFRLIYGREIVVIAFVVLTAVVAIVVVAFEASSGAAAVLGAVTTLIGTLVGTFFGAQIASQGQEREVASREKAQDLAVRTAALLDPQVVREYGPMLFGTPSQADSLFTRRSTGSGAAGAGGTSSEPGA